MTVGPKIARAIEFSTAYGLCLAILIFFLRLLALALLDGSPSLAPYFSGLMIGILSNLIFGQVLGVAIFCFPRGVFRQIITFALTFFSLVMMVVVTEFLFFSGTLPGPESLTPIFQLKEMNMGLESSLANRATGKLLVFLAFGLATLFALLVEKIHTLSNLLRGRTLILFLSLLVSAGTNVTLQYVPKGPFLFGAIHPIHYAFGRFGADFEAKKGEISIRELSRFVGNILGTESLKGEHDFEYPFCKKPAETRGQSSPRDMILLVLESVSARSLQLQDRERYVMPNLRDFANKNLHFQRFFANGYTSTQALPGIFSGIAPETHRKILYHAPLLAMDGFPKKLGSQGYRTAYLHGSDLSFDQQRQYLKMVGFEEVVEPTPFQEDEIVGWGIPDGPMLHNLQTWIREHRSDSNAQPYFASLFTITSHDPYEIPLDFEDKESSGETFGRYASTLRYLDFHLGKFFEWYEENEKAQGTVLLIVGDHAPRLRFPSDPKETTTGEYEYRFRVPFIMAGKNLPVSTKVENRLAGQMDVASTALGLAGLRGLSNCFMGHDLLAENFPSERRLVSIAGEGLEYLYLHEGNRRWSVHLANKEVHLHNPYKDPFFKNDLFLPEEGGWEEIREFVPAYLHLGYYLNLGEHYAPPSSKERDASLINTQVDPLIVSHRGNTKGPNPKEENSLRGIERAIEAGFEWVELDLQMTWDGIPILYHDAQILKDDGQRVKINGLSLQELQAQAEVRNIVTLREILKKYDGKIHFCLELKDQGNFLPNQKLLRAVIRELNAYLKESKVIVDSFNRQVLQSMREFSDYPLAFDLPQKRVKDYVLDYASESGMTWVYLRQDLISKDLVERAHVRGLKVMAYTVNDVLQARALIEMGVNGIMTDKTLF